MGLAVLSSTDCGQGLQENSYSLAGIFFSQIGVRLFVMLIGELKTSE
jgi:hypothetical protein